MKRHFSISAANYHSPVHKNQTKTKWTIEIVFYFQSHLKKNITRSDEINEDTVKTREWGPVYTDPDKIFARTNFLPGPPVYMDPCKFCYRFQWCLHGSVQIFRSAFLPHGMQKHTMKVMLGWTFLTRSLTH